MSVKLLTEHHLEFLSLKRGCRGSSESTLVKMLEISYRCSYTFAVPIESCCKVSVNNLEKILNTLEIESCYHGE